MQRVERRQDRRVARDLDHAVTPSVITQHDHRPEPLADGAGAVALHDEQPHQHGDADRQHESLQRRRDHSNPSTALSTEIAGVMTLSPIRTATHRTRRAAAARCGAWGCCRRRARASAVSAMMPPSPRLSARRISTTYLRVTDEISAQKITDARRPGAPHRAARRCRAEDFLDRVERAGADVAVDDADGTQGQRQKGFAFELGVHGAGRYVSTRLYQPRIKDRVKTV